MVGAVLTVARIVLALSGVRKKQRHEMQNKTQKTRSNRVNTTKPTVSLGGCIKNESLECCNTE